MPSPTCIDADFDTDTDPNAITDALEHFRPARPGGYRPRYDARGRLLPMFRVWMRDGYTLLTHAHTPGEACGNAIEDAHSMMKRIGQGRA